MFLTNGGVRYHVSYITYIGSDSYFQGCTHTSSLTSPSTPRLYLPLPREIQDTLLARSRHLMATHGTHHTALTLRKHSVPSFNSSFISLISVYHPCCRSATSAMSSSALEGISQARITEAPVYRASQADIPDQPAFMHSLKHCLKHYGAIKMVPPST